MKSILNKVFFFAFIAIWLSIIIPCLVLPKKEFSENENKVLAKIPEFTKDRLVEGDYMEGWNTYLNDHFVLRDQWISVQSVAEYALGKRESNGVYIGKSVLLNKLGTPVEKAIEQNTAGIKNFSQKFGKPVYVMIVPSNSAIEKEKLPMFAFVNDEKQIISDIYKNLDSVKTINAFDALEKNKNDYIYYRTDHHWTTYGAYLAYTEFCKTAGISPEQYDVTKISDDFNGTLYSRSGVRFIDSDSMFAFNTKYDAGCEVGSGANAKKYDSIYFSEYKDKKDKYCYFLGQNQPLVRIYGSNNTGKKLLMFKDSYSHCFAPMLLRDYDEIALVDLRYVNNLKSIIDISQYDEAMFLYSFDEFSSQPNSSKLSFLVK